MTRKQVIAEAKILADFKPEDDYEKLGLDEAIDKFLDLHKKEIINILSGLE